MAHHVTIYSGERWGLAVYLTETIDGVVTAVPMVGPAMAEIRTAAPGGDLIVRLDSAPVETDPEDPLYEGGIYPDELPRGGFILDLDTAPLPTGSFYWDFWARREDANATPRRLLGGTFHIRPRITDEIGTDV